MPKDRLHFLFLNIGHFLDHLFTLIFATVAALVLASDWGMSYAQLILYATPGLIAFGLFSLPAGWLADKWSREGMIAVFFIGIGLASIATAFAQSPIQIALGLFVVGIFAAIYHPVGIAMIAKGDARMGMALAINGVWGNMGVGAAALLTGFLIDLAGWRAGFFVPGAASVACGLVYVAAFKTQIAARNAHHHPHARTMPPSTTPRATLLRISALIVLATAVSSIIFQGTTFSLPKVFDERMGDIAGSATLIGWLAFLVFAIASMAQLVVGRALDRYSARSVYIVVALIQIGFFAIMPGQSDWAALAVALGFMLGAFGQIPITDYMIGQMAKSQMRASIFGARYIVSFGVWAAVVPLIAWVHHNWGFDLLFYILAGAGCVILAAVLALPKTLPRADQP